MKIQTKMKIQTLQEITQDLIEKNYDLDSYQLLKIAVEIQRNQILRKGLMFKHANTGEELAALYDLSCEAEKINETLKEK